MYDLLRTTLGYQGVVVSDCMEMAAIKEYYGTVQGTLSALNASVDLVFISHTPDLAAKAAKEAGKALANSSMYQNSHLESVHRIIELKRKISERQLESLTLVGCIAHKKHAREIREKSITMVSSYSKDSSTPPLCERPLFLGCRAYRATNASSLVNPEFNFPQYMQHLLGGRAIITPIDPTNDEISSICIEATSATSLVLGTYNGHINHGQLKLAHALKDIGIPLIVVATRNPYDLASFSSPVSAIAVYEYTSNIFDLLAEVLAGSITPNGTLPVSLKEATHA